jgi:hypothetical protein
MREVASSSRAVRRRQVRGRLPEAPGLVVSVPTRRLPGCAKQDVCHRRSLPARSPGWPLVQPAIRSPRWQRVLGLDVLSGRYLACQPFVPFAIPRIPHASSTPSYGFPSDPIAHHPRFYRLTDSLTGSCLEPTDFGHRFTMMASRAMVTEGTEALQSGARHFPVQPTTLSIPPSSLK